MKLLAGFHICLFLSPLLPSGAILHAAAAETGSADRSLARLQSQNAEERLAALRKLHTSLDPRIPKAMLSLLADEGDSIRRNAARAIGSRWWQISEEEIPAYVEALQRNLESDRRDEQNMARRAIALLQRSYSGDMVSQSPDGRWIIYERRGLPCLVETGAETEELLGWSPDEAAWLATAWGNETIESSVHWHPTQPMAALDILLNRRDGTTWIWREGRPLRQFTAQEALAAIGIPEAHLSPNFSIDLKEWKGEDLILEVSYGIRNSESGESTGHEDLLEWNSGTNSLRLLSRAVVKY